MRAEPQEGRYVCSGCGFDWTNYVRTVKIVTGLPCVECYGDSAIIRKETKAEPTPAELSTNDIQTVARHYPEWARTDAGIAALLDAAEKRLLRDIDGRGDYPK